MEKRIHGELQFPQDNLQQASMTLSRRGINIDRKDELNCVLHVSFPAEQEDELNGFIQGVVASLGGRER